uniref:HhH-GPD domain-containing protein n=1 Tax=Biomphalaria glabrata TaxID=6526 RepID=A0A2C9LV18_BIOGL
MSTRSTDKVSLKSPVRHFADIFDVVPAHSQCVSPILSTQFDRSEANDTPVKLRRISKIFSHAAAKVRQEGRKLRKVISAIKEPDCRKRMNATDNDKQTINNARNPCLLPRSPFFLVHELLYHNPWQLLVATILLENTTAHQKVVPVIWKILNHWPTPELASQADLNQVAHFIFPIGHNYQKAEAIINFSNDYLTKKWTYPIELKGIGPYGNDSYRIFCMNEWLQVEPSDKKLKRYCHWLKSNSERFGLMPIK